MKFAGLLAGLVCFVVLATANGAGYRYGVSDQAAYVPVVVRAAQPDFFPRDAVLLETQGHFFVLDEVLAGVSRATGASVEVAFFVAYLASLSLVWAGVLYVGSRLYSSPWLIAALGALITLRHHISRTSVNSLEPYFHPRVAAFGVGLLAVGALLRGRRWWAVLLVGAAALCHVTTALWFAVLIGTALAIDDSRWRRVAVAGVLIAAATLTWVMASGPLRSDSFTMDAVWIEALNGRNFIFANQWPLWAWSANLGLLAVLWWAHLTRVGRGTASSVDRGLVWGATALVAIFLGTLPAVSAHVAIATQLQISRVFWILDLLVAVYGLAAIGERLSWRGTAALALAILAVSLARGAFVLGAEHAERALFQISLPETAWIDAMRWIGRQPPDTYVLADPQHAAKFGSSVRVAAQRDVLLEDDKDSAIALYSRSVAVQVVSRRRALADFEDLTVERARVLAGRYGVNVLVTESTLDLRELYRNPRFKIYSLRPDDLSF